MSSDDVVHTLFWLRIENESEYSSVLCCANHLKTLVITFIRNICSLTDLFHFLRYHTMPSNMRHIPLIPNQPDNLHHRNSSIVAQYIKGYKNRFDYYAN